MPSTLKRRAASTDKWEDAAGLLKVIAHPVRLCVLTELARGAKCVMDLEELTPMSQPMLSQHMAVLRRAELVSNYARGPLRCYYLTRPAFTERLLAALESPSSPKIRPREDVLAEVDGRSSRRGPKKRAKR